MLPVVASPVGAARTDWMSNLTIALVPRTTVQSCKAPCQIGLSDVTTKHGIVTICPVLSQERPLTVAPKSCPEAPIG